jgi:hypothetical protein
MGASPGRGPGESADPGWRCTVAYRLRSVTSPGKRAGGAPRPPLISLRCGQFVTHLKHIAVAVTLSSESSDLRRCSAAELARVGGKSRETPLDCALLMAHAMWYAAPCLPRARARQGSGHNETVLFG